MFLYKWASWLTYLILFGQNVFHPELPAGRIDIGAELLADRRVDPLLHQAVPKGPDLGLGAPLIGFFFHWVIWDQIHISEGSADEFGKFIGAFQRIVHAFQHDIFEGDAAAAILFVIMDRFHQLIERISLRDRHDLLADLVIGGVQGNREVDLKTFLRVFLDPIDEAAGTDGDVPRPDR